eukprot:Gregarina_sp_Poly_1__7286@NODE_3_length_27868_cov_154_961188_g2_i0_p6_GENE_NODE_3_length_27868_cov_154_961188_g2_i0NODE_3_length_27868_cov_154_961188_g2_i0_p6_ORF_typecomplete_len672_score68_29OTT_1508_deam/PF14441_6/58OTT_1508_deam/PF14441_6/30zfRING_UBOX/PF13445_6/1_2e04zfRING_UBOX/PF13445_6/1zfRING_UBOX/PF13445_6/3_8e03_NODE_3_length_27868_cov_154_961188_g2_i046226637
MRAAKTSCWECAALARKSYKAGQAVKKTSSKPMKWWEYLRRPTDFEQPVVAARIDEYGVRAEGTSGLAVASVESELADSALQWLGGSEFENAVNLVLSGIASSLVRFDDQPSAKLRLYDFSVEIIPPLIKRLAGSIDTIEWTTWPISRKTIKWLRNATIGKLIEEYLGRDADSVIQIVENSWDEELLLSQAESSAHILPFILICIALFAPPQVSHTFCVSCLMEVDKTTTNILPLLIAISGLALNRHETHRSSFLASCTGLILSKVKLLGSDELSVMAVSICNFNRSLGEAEYEEQADDSQGVGRNVLYTLAATVLSWSVPAFKSSVGGDGLQVAFLGCDVLLECLIEIIHDLAIFYPKADLYEFSMNINTMTPLDEGVSDLELTPLASSMAVYCCLMIQSIQSTKSMNDCSRPIYPFSQVLSPMAKFSALLRPLFVLCHHALHEVDKEGPSREHLLYVATTFGLGVWNLSSISRSETLLSAHQSGFDMGVFVGQMIATLVASYKESTLCVDRVHALNTHLSLLIKTFKPSDRDDVCEKAIERLLRCHDVDRKWRSIAFILKHWRKNFDFVGAAKYFKLQGAISQVIDGISQDIIGPACVAVLDVCSTVQMLNSVGHVGGELSKKICRLCEKADQELQILRKTSSSNLADLELELAVTRLKEITEKTGTSH